MSRSPRLPERLDLDAGVPTTRDDIRRLRQLREAPSSIAEAFAAARAAGPSSSATLRKRGTTRGAPFEL